MRREDLAEGVTLYCGDCRDVLPTLGRVDAVVTDPPYGLGFMGKDWDSFVPNPEIWAEILRVLKPGGLFHSWTDVSEYFTLQVELFAQHEAYERLPDPPEREPEHDLDYRTSFERKKRRAGLPISRGLWRKR